MSRLHQFWLGWRREIVKGAFLFTVVLAIGIAATRMWGRMPFNVADMAFDDHFGDWRAGGDRNWDEAFRWAGQVGASQWAWIRNTNGPVIIEPSDGDSFVVFADKRSRRSNPDDVEIRAVENPDGSITVCALWRAAQTECGPSGEYRMKDMKKNDVAVRFRVLVPRGVRLDASTVNGQVQAEGAAAELVLATVNGGIQAEASGPIRATTVNGSVSATIDALTAGTEPVELKTVNGAIRVELPADLNADLEASTVSGRVSTALPIKVVGRVNPRQLRARLGEGGRRLTLSTVNGQIRIEQLDADHVHAPDPDPNP
jgi:hypothetical protein